MWTSTVSRITSLTFRSNLLVELQAQLVMVDMINLCHGMWRTTLRLANIRVLLHRLVLTVLHNTEFQPIARLLYGIECPLRCLAGRSQELE